MAEITLDVLSDRLRCLEEKVYGKYDAACDTDSKVLDSLLSVDTKINTVLTGREKVKSVLKRLDDVERYLDPSVGERLTLEDTTKMDIIFTEEQYIRETAAILNKVHELKPILDSEHIKAVPSYSGQLVKLNKIELEQEKLTGGFSEEVKDLVSSYNNIITMLTKQFVQWDELVTKMEIASQSSTKKK